MGIQTVNETWQLRAACRGPESTLFFPPTSSERKEEREARETKAKSICATCSPATTCASWRSASPFTTVIRLCSAGGNLSGVRTSTASLMAARSHSSDLRKTSTASSELVRPTAPMGLGPGSAMRLTAPGSGLIGIHDLADELAANNVP